MDIQNRRALRSAASEALTANPGNPRLLVIAYILITALSALLVSALITILGDRIDQTGGLSDLGLRSILSTAQTVLPIAHALALLGIQLGYQNAALSMARRQAVGPRSLLDGFRRYAPLLRSVLLQGLLYLLIGICATYAATFIFMMTPLVEDFRVLVEPMLTDPDALYDALYNDTAFAAAAGKALLPFFPIFLAVFLAAAAPFFYQYRMTNYCLLDDPRKGALAAMSESARMMRGHRLDLLKLDLGFWWFYLGEAFVALVLYGDLLLPMVGVTLPWSSTVNYYVFYAASLVLEGGLFFACLNRVETTYATAYEALRPKPQPSQGAVLGNIFDLAREYYDENQ